MVYCRKNRKSEFRNMLSVRGRGKGGAYARSPPRIRHCTLAFYQEQKLCFKWWGRGKGGCLVIIFLNAPKALPKTLFGSVSTGNDQETQARRSEGGAQLQYV